MVFDLTQLNNLGIKSNKQLPIIINKINVIKNGNVERKNTPNNIIPGTTI